MTMDEENIESLIRRWQGLDGLLTNCVIAGTKPPTELEQELMQLEGELKSRGVEEPRGPLFTDWLGQKLSGFVVDYLMEEGIYWYLFHGKLLRLGRKQLLSSASSNRNMECARPMCAIPPESLVLPMMTLEK